MSEDAYVTVGQSPARFASELPEAARIAQWRRMKFGLMLHWGLYSLPGGVWNGENIPGYNEQIMHRAKISWADYGPLASQFTAEKYDPDFIARVAKEAGMSYVVITSKHHDGFNLYHTQLSDFNTVDATPFGRDAVKLLAQACERQRLQFGLYYSLIDWHYPGALPMSDHNSDAITPALEEYTAGQLCELLTGYGPLCELWFDMSKPTREQSARFAALVHALQPNCLVSGRIWNGQDDFQMCSDNETPDKWLAGAWESAITVFHETWGYRSWETRDDLPGKIREKICDLALVTAKGGNYLLNIGPRGDGSLVEFEVEMLRGIGRWMQANSEAIYGASPEPHLLLEYGYAASRPGRLYLFVADPPADGLLRVPHWQSPLPQAHVLTVAPAEGLSCRLDRGDLNIALPANKLDANLTVVAIDYEGAQPFLPTQLLRFRPQEKVSLGDDVSLPWHRLAGEDYYSLRTTVVAREWNLLPEQTGKWRVAVRRVGGGPAAGFVLTFGSFQSVFLLPEGETPQAHESAPLTLEGGVPVGLKLQALIPGGLLAEDGLILELVPASETDR